MTIRPHDALLKSAFQDPRNAAGLLQRVLPADLARALDTDSLVRLAGSYIDPDLADRHTDLLFAVTLQDVAAYLYVVLEHQSTNDPDLPLRLLVYMVRIWERFRRENPGTPLPPIVPVVLSHAPGGWTSARRFQDLFGSDLHEVPRLRDFVPPHGLEAVAQLMKYFAYVTNDVLLEQIRAKIRPLVPEAEEIAVTIAEQMHEEGRAQGRAQGRAEAVLKMLTLKFGSLSQADEGRVAGATAEELDRYIERAMTETTLEAVFASR